MKQFYFTLVFLIFSLFASAQSTEVGETEGALNISLTGNANYTIPILTPPGINGFEPQVSVNYNSQRGLDGTAAKGWDISGVSSITRIPATKFHDGKIDPVDFNSFDRFALDGQRLIVKNGTSGVYGANNTIYETEYFSNIKITSYGVHPNGANFGPEYFIVEYPNGTKAYYGSSSDSRTVMEWSIKYTDNAQGVRISYEYSSANNTLYIASIKYGAMAGLAPINEINFIYGIRSNIEDSYVGGINIKREKNLTAINVIGSGEGFRNYIFGYEIQDRITFVTEKNGDSSKSYNPTKFKYGTGSAGQIKYKQANDILDVGNINSLNTATVSGDFDGDGNMDFILYRTAGAAAKAKYWVFSNPSTPSSMISLPSVVSFDEIFPVSYLDSNNKLSQAQGWTVVKAGVFTTFAMTVYGILQRDQKTYTFPRFILDYQYQCSGTNPGPELKGTGELRGPIKPPGPIDVHYESDIPRNYISGDFNGDGITDIIAVEKMFTYPYRYMCTQYESTYQGGKAFFINLDKRVTSNFANVVGFMETTDSSDIKIADFNGDGKSDIYIFDTGKVKIYSLNDNMQLILLYQTSGTDANIILGRPILLGDYNGDGKTDFMVPKAFGSSSWFKYTSTGNSLLKEEKTSEIFFTANDSYNTYNYIPVDFNNDSKTDIIRSTCFRNSADTSGIITVGCYPNSNGSFRPGGIPVINTGDQPDINIYALPVFLPSSQQVLKNGLYTSVSNLQVAFLNLNKLHFFSGGIDLLENNLLTKIISGNSVEETISYIPLDTSYKNDYNSIYTPSLVTADYPYMDIQTNSNLFLVSKIEQKSEDVYRKKLFGYHGGVTNIEGLGFIGFRSVSQTNWHDDSSKIFTSISKNNIDIRGAVVENAVVPYLAYPSAVPLPSDFDTKSITVYNNVVENPLLGNKVFKLKTTNVKEFNTLNDTSTELKDIVYDDYNNIKSSTTISSSGQTPSKSSKTDVEYQTPVTNPLYILGRPGSKTETVTADGHTMSTTEVYTYNSQQLLSNTDKSAAGTAVISESNDYDSYGNIIKKSIKPPLPLLPRQIGYEYDSTGRFITKITDNDDLVSTFEYYPNGLLKKETDPYSVSKSYTYDSWFKNLTVTTAGNQLNQTIVNNYARNGKKTVITSTIGGSGLDTNVSEETFDDLGRKTKSGAKDLNGNFSYTSYLYDIYDRNYKVSEPYFGALPSQWNEVKFDDYGRNTSSILFNQRATSISYTPASLTATFTDGAKSKVSTKNAAGNTISTNENIGGTIGYRYFANGNLRQTAYNDINIVMEQNGWGDKTKLKDPSAGTYNYNYNDLGELTSETIDGTGITTTIIRNAKTGRPVTKTITGSGTNSITTYSYDGPLPLTIDYTDNNGPAGSNRILTTISYDSSKRVSSILEERLNVSRFTTSFIYDGQGRVATETKTAEIGGRSSTVKTRNQYLNGDLYQILDDATGKMLWQTNILNEKGQVLDSDLGNGIKVTNAYNTDGYLSKIQFDKTTSPVGNVLTLSTDFDKNNDNLRSRTNSAFGNYTENFSYDALDRLVSFTNRLGIQETQSYDASGKILSNNLGTYDYDPVKKYQNTAVNISPEASGYYANREGIFNDSMESSNGWSINDTGISYDKTITAHSGATSLKIINTGGAAEKVVHSDIWTKIDNSVPTEYTYSAWVKSDGPQSEVFLFMKTDNEQGYFTQVDSKITNVINQWTEITGTFLVPANIKKLNIRLDNNGQGTVWFDDVKLRKTSEPVSSLRQLNVSYNAFKSPLEIEETNVDKISFSYNDNNQRSIMYYGDLQTEKIDRILRKYYSADGSMEVKHNTKTNTFEFITYIAGDGYSAPIAAKSDGINSPDYLYLHRDYQGTILAVTSSNGALVEKRLFDAWGALIKVVNGTGDVLSSLSVLDRGYTGHEHLQSVGLINMNARLYDPLLHRFLQADNYIQDPTSTQNYNQYGYVLNNPLAYIDPSGNVAQGTGPGKDCVDCGWGAAIGSGISTISQNWDNWRIKDWANKNVNGNEFSKWWKSKVSFNNFFGGGGKESAPPPNMSSYVNISDNSHNIVAPPYLAKYNQYKKEYKQWEKKSFVDRLLSGRPEDPYMIASSGGLEFVTGEAEVMLFAKAGEKAYEVYHLINKETKAIEYVGKTGQGFLKRFDQHLLDPAKQKWIHNVEPILFKSGLSRYGAKYYEQTEILSIKLEKLYNKINAVGEKYWAKYGIKIE